MQRVIIMGPPGSGKSTLARELGAHHGLPVFHLDQAYWSANWIAVPSEVFKVRVEHLAELDRWVMDGNYTATIGPRLLRADTVIYLDVPSLTSMVRILRRMVMSYGQVRADAAPGCVERVNWPFLGFVWSWNRIRRDTHLALVGSFPGSRYVVRSRAEKQRLLADDPA